MAAPPLRPTWYVPCRPIRPGSSARSTDTQPQPGDGVGHTSALMEPEVDGGAEMDPSVEPGYDGSLLVTRVECGFPTRGSLIDTRTGEELLDLGPGEIWTAQFTSGGGGDRSRYAVVLREGVVAVFDTRASQRVGIIEPADDDIINSFDVDPSGLRLVTGSEQGLAHIHALPNIIAGNSADEAIELRLDTTDIVAGITVDGPHLATSSHGLLSVWDIETGRLLFQPPVQIETPPFSDFTPDGRSLIFVDGEYELRRLILDPEELVQHARQRLTREFTDAECNTYLGPESCEQDETWPL